MPKQSKNKTTVSETERLRAEILHNRRVKEILEENERKRTPFDRWSRQSRHLDMRFYPYSKGGFPTHRAGLIIKDEDGIYRRAIRPPHHGLERDIMEGRMHRGAHNRVVYVPEGFFGAEVGGSGKPKKKASKAKRS
jgi:hypothetical protein